MWIKIPYFATTKLFNSAILTNTQQMSDAATKCLIISKDYELDLLHIIIVSVPITDTLFYPVLLFVTSVSNSRKYTDNFTCSIDVSYTKHHRLSASYAVQVILCRKDPQLKCANTDGYDLRQTHSSFNCT